MKILLTNDDGYRAPGILALYNALKTKHEVTLAAPDRERSAIGHGITLHHPLKYEPVHLNGGGSGYAVSGTPADCVKLGLFDICQGKPDLVISGINAGSNTGVNINYSGTAGAAREAAINNIGALAVSIQYGEVMDFEGMADYTASNLDRIKALDLPKGVFLNINGPAIPIEQVNQVRITCQADNNLSNTFDRRTDPRDRCYYWYGNMEPVDPGPETDNNALAENCISITPLQCDMTAYAAMDILNKAGF